MKLSGVDVFADHLVLFERAERAPQIRVRRLADGDEHVIDQPEAVSTATGAANPEFDADVLRYRYTSMVTPSSVFDYDIDGARPRAAQAAAGARRLRPERYVTERLWATAERRDARADVGRVPADRPRDRPGPRSSTATAPTRRPWTRTSPRSASRCSTAGFVFAIAHIRGGGEMGRRWYIDGKS